MISVVIVSYRTGPVLMRCLDAALLQEDVGEVVLVDNGNPSGVLEELRLLADREPRLTLVTGHGNIGFAAACNLGAAEAGGEHLLFLNPDAVLPAGAAGLLRNEGEGRGLRLWAAGPKLTDPDGREQRGSRRAILTPGNAFVEATRLYKLAPNHPYFRRLNDHEAAVSHGTRRVPCLSGAVFMVPREAWEAIGGMDARFFLHVEDIDFFLRLGKAGGRMLFVPQVAVPHYKSSSRVDPLDVERLKKQSLNLYFDTHFKGVYPPGFLSLLRGMLWLSFGARMARRQTRRGLRSLAFVLRHGPLALRRARRMTPRIAVVRAPKLSSMSSPPRALS